MGAQRDQQRLAAEVDPPQECRELNDEIFALAQRYRRDGTPAPAEARRVFLQVQLLPFVQEPA